MARHSDIVANNGISANTGKQRIHPVHERVLNPNIDDVPILSHAPALNRIVRKLESSVYGASGLRHRNPGNRAKSVSLECNSAWCSIAKAAKCASVVIAPPAVTLRVVRRSARCRGPGLMIETLTCWNHDSTRCSASAGVAGTARTLRVVLNRIKPRTTAH